MKKHECALLVIDMQQVAFDGEITPPVNLGSQLLDTVADLIEGCRSKNIPILFAQTNAPPGRPYAKDTHGWNVHAQVTPLAGEQIIFKVGPSAFETPELEVALNELGSRVLIVCGIWSEGCVSITARGALKRGYGVCLASDGHGTVRDNDEEARAIIREQNELLSERGVSVIETRVILALLA